MNAGTDVPGSINTGFLYYSFVNLVLGSFGKSYSFVDLVLPSGLTLCFPGIKSRKEFQIVLFSFKECFPAYRKYLMGEGSFYNTDHALQSVCNLHNMKVPCGIIGTENEIFQNGKGQEAFY